MQPGLIFQVFAQAAFLLFCRNVCLVVVSERTSYRCHNRPRNCQLDGLSFAYKHLDQSVNNLLGNGYRRDCFRTGGFMKNIWLATVILLAASHPCCAIYGPSLIRADASVALRACQEAKFVEGQEIIRAIHSRNPADAAGVLGGALREWRATPITSAVYPARAFCIHELVPNHLPREGTINSDAAKRPTAAVSRFRGLGISYFYYEPDAHWVLREDPVDLNQLAKEHLDSPWGRQAFLMMTRIGWSQGGCKEGPDQFREVIKHGEKFLEHYPQSEVSDNVRLELARAYETWWNLSNAEPNPSESTPASFKEGADAAKHKAIELYQEYLKRQGAPAQDVRSRLKALQENPKGSNHYDYYCPEYAD